MKKFLVIGNPIEHSLSPKLHNYWIKKNNLDAIYGKLETYDNDLSELCKSIKNGDLEGLNVTVPFKKSIIPHLDILSSNALRTQSVNTISLNKGHLIGDNTDINGFELSIRKLNYDVSDKTVLILGAGGVVPSIIFSLLRMKASKILLSNRTKEKAINLKNFFKKINSNSIDGVSDRDFIIEFLSSISISMMHLSRISEELIIWCSEEFDFIKLSDDVVTTSSMMPQKRNPDFLELIRGKFGGILGNFISLLVTMKSLPFSYNRDMQEDKKPLINSVDEFSNSLINMTQIIKKSKFNKNKLENATNGNILATDIADLLAINGVPFREAHIKVSDLTNKLNKQDKVLSDLSPADLKEMLKIDFNLKINLLKSINSRKLKGGTATAQVRKEIITAKKSLNL